MQKVLRINLNARNQGLQKARRKHLKDLRKKWQAHDDHRVILDRSTRNLVKTERKERREDWLAGPLAPKRDVGKNYGVYGALPSSFMRGPEIPDAVSKWPKSKGDDLIGDDWKGKGNEGNLVVGDRVCVVRGADTILGQIGTIHEISKERRELTVKGLNTVCLPPSLHITLRNEYNINISRSIFKLIQGTKDANKDHSSPLTGRFPSTMSVSSFDRQNKIH